MWGVPRRGQCTPSSKRPLPNRPLNLPPQTFRPPDQGPCRCAPNPASSLRLRASRSPLSPAPPWEGSVSAQPDRRQPLRPPVAPAERPLPPAAPAAERSLPPLAPAAQHPLPPVAPAAQRPLPPLAAPRVVPQPPRQRAGRPLAPTTRCQLPPPRRPSQGHRPQLSSWPETSRPSASPGRRTAGTQARPAQPASHNESIHLWEGPPHNGYRTGRQPRPRLRTSRKSPSQCLHIPRRCQQRCRNECRSQRLYVSPSGLYPQAPWCTSGPPTATPPNTSFATLTPRSFRRRATVRARRPAGWDATLLPEDSCHESRDGIASRSHIP